ncbi:MAG: hypothetical protein WC203_02850 [Candidatus Bathyarchaeia archaeon]|nr:hypothetical protein [Candidatus Bathyarchaeota archaeon]MDI9577677.1 hypothetical protein [Thermoproteota archaeon]
MDGGVTRKLIVGITVVSICVILLVVLFATQLEDNSPKPYVARYIPGFYSSNTTYGNIILVNPASNFLENLNMTIQVDNSELILPNLRVWYSNYTVNTPNSYLESVNMSMDVKNFSAPITKISIEPKQNLTINLGFSAPDTFQFSAHNLTIYLSQHSFGDIIDGQTMIIPQTEAHIQIVSYSQVHTDYDTHHKFYSPTRQGYVYRNDNPNFIQRYFNISWEIGTANYALAADMGVLGVRYFNVTVYNNNSFAVNSVRLFGQLSSSEYVFNWRALPDYVLQPGETYVFPVGEKEIPTQSYATGYITNSTLQTDKP